MLRLTYTNLLNRFITGEDPSMGEHLFFGLSLEGYYIDLKYRSVYALSSSLDPTF